MSVRYLLLAAAGLAACTAGPPLGEIPATTFDPEESRSSDRTPDDAQDDRSGVSDHVGLELEYHATTKFMHTPVFIAGPANGFVIWSTEASGSKQIDLGEDGAACVDVDLVKDDTITARFRPFNAAGKSGEEESILISQEGETPPEEAIDPIEPPSENLALDAPLKYSNLRVQSGRFPNVVDGDHRDGFVATKGDLDTIPQILIKLPNLSFVTKLVWAADEQHALRDSEVKIFVSADTDPPWIRGRSIQTGTRTVHVEAYDVPSGAVDVPTYRTTYPGWTRVATVHDRTKRAEVELRTPIQAQWVGFYVPVAKGRTFGWQSTYYSAAELEVHGYAVTWRPPPPPAPPETAPRCPY